MQAPQAAATAKVCQPAACTSQPGTSVWDTYTSATFLCIRPLTNDAPCCPVQGAPLNESDHCGDPPLLLAAGNGGIRWRGGVGLQGGSGWVLSKGAWCWCATAHQRDQQ